MAQKPDLSVLPVTIEKNAAAWFRFGQLFFGIPALAVGILFVESGDVLGALPYGIGLCLLVVLLIEVLYRVFGPRFKAVYTIDRSLVLYQHAKGERWTESLSAYDGVLWREEVRGSGKNRRRYYIIELRHASDPDSTVKIVESTRKSGIRAFWEGAAKSLELAALRREGEGQVTRRAPGDLDKSVRELAREGKVDTAFDAQATPPSGIVWQRGADQLAARTKLSLLMSLLNVGFVGVFMTIWVIGIGNAMGFPVATFAGGLVIPVLALVMFTWRQEIRITATTTRLSHRVLGLPLRRRRLINTEIESVSCRPGKANIGGVLIESDAGALALWGLPNDNAEWMAAFIRSALAHTPG